MNQCHGTTTKGIRCKLKSNDKYCHYHINQAGSAVPKFPRSPAKKPSTSPVNPKNPAKPTNPTYPAKPVNPTYPAKPATPKPGYIYVYTMTRLLTHDKHPWLNVKNLPNSKNKKWVPFDSKSSSYILIKVGMTTQTVSKRIQQWKDKCHHDLTVLSPGQKFSESSLKRLVAKFKNISLEPTPTYRTFRNDGFYSKGDIRRVESEVHRQLRKKYGYGDMLCIGCEKTPSSKSGGPFSEVHNIHVEWFLVPKVEMPWVYGVIDKISESLS